MCCEQILLVAPVHERTTVCRQVCVWPGNCRALTKPVGDHLRTGLSEAMELQSIDSASGRSFENRLVWSLGNAEHWLSQWKIIWEQAFMKPCNCRALTQPVEDHLRTGLYEVMELQSTDLASGRSFENRLVWGHGTAEHWLSQWKIISEQACMRPWNYRVLPQAFEECMRTMGIRENFSECWIII